MRRALAGVAGAALALAGCHGAARGGGGGSGDEGAVTLTHDATVGALYGVQGPRKCSSRKEPKDGPPSPALIAKYVICGDAGEGTVGDSLFLLDNVQVTEIAPGRPFNPNNDVQMSNIDISKPIFAIKGGYSRYQCDHVNKPGGYNMGPDRDPGRNCNVETTNAAQGTCFQDTFGDWYCQMQDNNAAMDRNQHTAPPNT